MDKILVCNMKMQNNIKDMLDFIKGIDTFGTNNLIVCPTYIYIPFFLNKKYSIGSQNYSMFTDYSHTGEVSIEQLKNMNVRYSLVGHLDLRYIEDDSVISKKVKLAIKNGIIPIICVGETLEERKMLKTERVLKKQLLAALRDVDLDKVIIAYNPGWILTSRDKDDVEEIINFIKNIVELNFKYENVKVICGEINEQNIQLYNEIEKIDGFITSITDVSFLSSMLEVISK